MQITSTSTRVTTVTILAQKRLDDQQKAAANAKPAALGDAVTKLLNWSPNQKSEASDALDKLEQARKQLISDQKGNARQRLEQIKKQLQLLRAFGGDPKAIARIAKQLAQELKQAAQDYGQAVKDEGGTAGTEAASPETGTTATNADATATPEPSAKDPDAERQAAYDKINSQIAQSDQKFNAKKADSEAVDDFKSVAQELKALLKRAANELRRTKGNDTEAEDFLKTAKELTKAIEDLATAVNGKQDEPSDNAANTVQASGAESYSLTATSVSVEVVQTINISA